MSPAEQTEAEATTIASFAAAMAELDAILARIEHEEVDIDRLAIELARAAELVNLCRGKLRKAEVEVTQILGALDSEDD